MSPALKPLWKVIALTAVAAILPAQGHCSDVTQATQLGSADLQNTQPVAGTDYVDVENAGTAFNVLANDSDADQDKLTIVAATAQHGAVAFTADGLVAYAADPTRPRADEIKYVLTDGRGGRTMGKVIVTAP